MISLSDATTSRLEGLVVDDRRNALQVRSGAPLPGVQPGMRQNRQARWTEMDLYPCTIYTPSLTPTTSLTAKSAWRSCASASPTGRGSPHPWRNSRASSNDSALIAASVPSLLRGCTTSQRVQAAYNESYGILLAWEPAVGKRYLVVVRSGSISSRRVLSLRNEGR